MKARRYTIWAASLVAWVVAVVRTPRLDDRSLSMTRIFYGGSGLVVAGAIAHLRVIAHAEAPDRRRSKRKVVGTLGTVSGFVAGSLLGAW